MKFYSFTTVTIESEYNDRGERIYVVRERAFRNQYDERPKVTERMSGRSYLALVDVLNPAR